MYRPPGNNEFWDNICNNLDYVKSNSNTQYIMIIGDMNADFSTVNGRKLKELCSLHNLDHLIKEPTRVTEESRTCLDQILTNFPNFVRSTLVDTRVATNDHCTISVKLDFKGHKDIPYHRLVWLYKHGDYDGFRAALLSASWEDVFEDYDIDIICEKWTEKVLSIAKSFIPNKLVLVRPKDKPWYSSLLRKMKRKVSRVYKRAKKSNASAHWEMYKQMQLNYKKALDEAELAHKERLNEKITQNRNSKTWWGLVKKILGKGGSDSYPPMKDSATGQFVYDSGQKANLVNQFFLSHTALGLSNAMLPDDGVVGRENTIDHIEVNEPEILVLINNIDTNKATGPDGISPKMLKEAGVSIVLSLTKLI